MFDNFTMNFLYFIILKINFIRKCNFLLITTVFPYLYIFFFIEKLGSEKHGACNNQEISEQRGQTHRGVRSARVIAISESILIIE